MIVKPTREEARLSRFLSVVALVLAVLTLATLVGAYLGPSTTFFVQPPWVSNTAAALAVLGLLAWFAAADVRRFQFMVRLLIAGLALGALLSVVLLGSPSSASQVTPLLLVAIGGAAIAIGLATALRRTKVLKPTLPWVTDKPLTLPEQVGRVVFGIFGVASLIFAAVLYVPAFLSPINPFFTQPVFVAGSTVKISLLGILALTAAYDLRRYGEAVTLLILAHGVSLLAAAISLLGIARFGSHPLEAYGMALTTQGIMQGVVGSDALIIIVFSGLKILMGRAVFDYLGYLGPGQFRTVEALIESILEDPVVEIPPHEAALRVDRYLSSFPSKRLALTRLAVIGLEYAPLACLQPPLSLLAPSERKDFVNRQYRDDLHATEGRNLILDLIRTQLQGALRIGMQAVYLGYYSDPVVHQGIGYVPFSQRPKNFPVDPVRKYPKLQVTTPDDVRRMGLDVLPSADVVIIGSGAAGSILAEQLLAQGRDVLLLERGLYVDPDDFTEDEVQQVGRLYGDGALQVSQSYRFQILQASCVGGGTVVNNAVCFDTPDRVLREWNDPLGPNAGIDVASFREAQRQVKDRLRIRSIKDSTRTRKWPDVLNPGDAMIERGIAQINLPPGSEFDVVRANIDDCLGCGYCNIGCRFGRKLSMLDEVLPKAQQDYGADRLRIFSEAEAVRLNGNGGKVTEVVVQLRDGRQILVRNPKTVVVSAGTVASSWLLKRSGIGEGELPVGQHLCFNMGSPLHGYWPPRNSSHLQSYAGLQIAHYLELGDEPGFVYETWYNPPVAQALAMPGWLKVHERNMRRYADLAAVGVLVGTETNAYITPALLLRGAADVVYKPTDHDLKTLVRALQILGRILFASGAEEVMASAMSYREEAIFRHPDELDRLANIIQDDRDIVLGTGHPQGGNAISKVRGQNRGVIDPDFKVYGYENLYVCDASVFPSPTTVNPQLTVMTMAQYAASRVR